MQPIGVSAELWSIDEAARYLSISASSLRQMLAQGNGPSYIPIGPRGGKKKFRKSDIDAWLDSRCVRQKATRGSLRHIKTKGV